MRPGPESPDPYPPPSGSVPHQPYPPPSGSVPHQPYPPPPPDPYAMPTNQPYPTPPPPHPYGTPTTPSGQEPYGGTPMYPNAGPPFPAGQQNTLGLIAMILGIASVPLVCCHLGLPLGIAAMVTGWLGQQKVEQGLAGNRGQALAGLICGAIGAVLGLGWGVVTVLG
nr:DUF4190 domain-containing protein [Salinispora arenicola]